jgi:hypothetical protein
MNLVMTLALAWVFSFFEDIWFNRLLGYQLSGESERLKRPAGKALEEFDRRTGSHSWLLLAGGLTLIVLAFPEQFTLSVFGLSFVAGVCLCLLYVGQKLRAYGHASRFQRERLSEES